MGTHRPEVRKRNFPLGELRGMWYPWENSRLRMLGEVIADSEVNVEKTERELGKGRRGDLGNEMRF